MKKYHLHHHKINERDNPRSRPHYWLYMRRWWHLYKTTNGKEREIFEGHVEYSFRKKVGDSIFSIRLHTGNMGSETPWDGHLTILWFSFYWSHTAFRKLAARISRCGGYQYDTRNWTLRIFSNRLWWEFGTHSDMCDLHRQNRRKKKTGRRRTFREGSFTLSIPELIWGPKRYTYDTIDSFATMLKFKGEGSYPAIIDLQKVYLGRTKVPRAKHVQSWNLEVDSPTGIPTHVDHSGGWKGDRTHGFGVKFDYPQSEGWQIDAEAAVVAWVLSERARTGFRSPDPVGRD